MINSPIPPQRPNMDEPISWRVYWDAQNQPWRTEPEIDGPRQKYLSTCLAIESNPLQGRDPFKDVALSRADVEWLIAAHGDKRRSINLRQSDLRQVKLSGLPLQGADLLMAHLQGADLIGAHLERAVLIGAHLEGADLSEAHLQGADLSEAHLQGAVLSMAHLYEAKLIDGVERADLSEAHLEGANLREAHLEGAKLSMAHLEGTNLRKAHLEGADLSGTYLQGTNLSGAYLEGANLGGVHLQGAFLSGAHLEGANLRKAHLEGADLSNAFFTSTTNLEGIVLGNKQVGFASLAGVRWGEVDLSVVDWTPVNTLGDEQWARQRQTNDGELEDAETRLDDYRTAVRANRQLATVLRDQGMNEEADRFAYRAQVLQRVVWRRQRKFLKYVGSWLLSMLAGYGYRPLRSVLVYVLLILGFAAAFFALGHLKWYEALVVSLTAFHGRGFFSQQYQPGDPQSIIAALEAVVGLLIEISFIATFTQRFFGK